MSTINNVQLNEYIFKEILVYLLYNLNDEKEKQYDKDRTQYNQLLEYSLLSKQSFSITQHIIKSNQFNKIYFILSPIDYIVYMKNQTKKNNNNNKQQYHLIQYEEIETIRFKGKDSTNFKSLKHFIENGVKRDPFYYDKFNQGNNEAVKQFFKLNCPNLKQCILDELIYVSPDISCVGVNENFGTDFTCEGFYKVKRLVICFDQFLQPYSNGETFLQSPTHGNTPQYSFNYIGKYSPWKIYFGSTGDPDMFLQLNHMNGILNHKTIKKINFYHDHTTPDMFFKQVIQQNKVKSFTARLIGMNSYGSWGGANTSDDEVREYDGIYDGIGSNTSLKKLKLKRTPDDYYPVGWNNNQCLSKLLFELSLNNTITSLSLEAFNIEHLNLLSPLIQIKNITTLHCHHVNLNVFIDHCNENFNIKKLVISRAYLGGNGTYEDGEYYDSYKGNVLKEDYDNYLNNALSLRTIKNINLTIKKSKN